MATTCKLIAKNILSSTASNVIFSNIPNTYTDLLLICSSRTNRNERSEWIQIDFNENSTNQSTRYLLGSGASPNSGTYSAMVAALATGATATSNTFGNSELYIPNYTGSTNKPSSMVGVTENNAEASDIYINANLWSNTSAITSIKLYPSTGITSIQVGSSFFLYGITKA